MTSTWLFCEENCVMYEAKEILLQSHSDGKSVTRSDFHSILLPNIFRKRANAIRSQSLRPLPIGVKVFWKHPASLLFQKMNPIETPSSLKRIYVPLLFSVRLHTSLGHAFIPSFKLRTSHSAAEISDGNIQEFLMESKHLGIQL